MVCTSTKLCGCCNVKILFKDTKPLGLLLVICETNLSDERTDQQENPAECHP